MKKKLLLFCLSLFAIQCYAQQHEIGLGVGYVELNPYAHSVISEKWTISSPFYNTVTNINGWFMGQSLIMKQFIQTPSLYYQLNITDKFSTRISYVYNFQKGENKYAVQDEQGKPATYRFEAITHALSTGYAYYLNKNKKLRPYIASDIECYLVNQKETEVINYSSGCFFGFYINEHNIVSRNDLSWNINQAVGLQASLCKKMNIKYEVSARFRNGDLVLRPLNRFSLNYQF